MPTIISRCQRFDFARIDQQAIEAHLTGIAAKEAIHITPEAIRLIARHVRGGLRDALGMLPIRWPCYGLACRHAH
ncbi:MAG: hypothetical protein R2857_15380 [Vampirovibrionales bacterium]